MEISALLPLLAVFAAVLGILFLVTGRLGTKASGSNRVLGQMIAPAKASGFPSALVATTAIAITLSKSAIDPFTTGSVLGLLFTVLNVSVLEPLRKVLYAVAGITGTIATLLINVVQVPGCASLGPLGIWFAILLATIAALAAAAGWIIGHTPTTPLAFFSALSILTFLASPLGVPAFSTTNPALTTGIGIIAAAVFGYAAGRWPAPVIGLAALTITLTAAGTAAFVIPTCKNAFNGHQIYTLIAFFAVYLLIHFAMAPFRRKARI